ncbi:MAG: cobyrinate a,c-diamide synthase [Terriglobales bacterium]
MRAFLVAGTNSGVGKTTVTLALIAGLRARGLRVRAFKLGPDFLDPAHLAAASSAQCYSLDPWMMSREGCRQRLAGSCADADIAVIEGMMGLFDGRSGASDEGSAAQLAKWFDLPVVLVADAAGGTRSLAATVLGFKQFDSMVRLVGVIFNRIGGPGHAEYLRAAMASVPAVAVLGAVPADERLHIPERHLGLTLPPGPLAGLGAAARCLDLDRVVEMAAEFAPAPVRTRPASVVQGRLRLGVARDEAFCFYYPDNLDMLRDAGFELVEFSPLHDAALPPELGGVYFGGGYPELHSTVLSANTAMRAAVCEFGSNGGFVYAECGGLMYLAQSLNGLPMAGLIPASVNMEKRLQAIGYREVRAVAFEVSGDEPLHARGHEFHYSRTERTADAAPALLVSAQPEGFHIGNVVASYIHLHFASCPLLPAHFARMAVQARSRTTRNVRA